MRNPFSFFKKSGGSDISRFRVDTSPAFDLSPEDILPDSSTDFNRGFAPDRKLEVPVASPSISAFFAFVVLGFVLLGGYTTYVVATHGETYSRLARLNAQQAYEIGPSRGTIVSSDGVLLATTTPSFNLVVNPTTLSDEDAYSLARDLSSAREELSFDVTLERLLSARDRTIGQLELLKRLSEQEVAELTGVMNAHPWLFVVEVSVRFYPEGELFAHLLGYTAAITEEELANVSGYTASDEIGKQGIEYYYEDRLRGEKGLFAKLVTVQGRVVSERIVEQPVIGSTLELSVDAGLQRASYEALQKSLEQNNISSGVVVALDPRTGEIKALVSLPSFDPNHFTRGLSAEQFKAYFENIAKPLFNRALSGTYPTGSVIKPLIATAALEERIINAAQSLFTEGYISVPSVFDPSVIYTFLDWKNHGWVTMREAIAVSSNVYFYTIGGGYRGQEGLGIERIARYLRLFNWGEKLGIQFGSESEGLIPSAQWKERVKGEAWYIGDTYNVSIGQGDILVSPLQVAISTAVFANGGTLYRPYVVAREVRTDGSVLEHTPYIIRQDFVDASSLEVVREGMRSAVSIGSSQYLLDLPVSVAGKTGTAQIGGGINHGWFSGFAPYESPELVVTVLLERGQRSTEAVRVANDIWQWYFTNRAQELST